MGHLLRDLREEYRALSRRLDTNVVGLPEPVDALARQGWRTILELLYRPEEAALGSILPHAPSTLEEIARVAGRGPVEVGHLLNSMAEKGVVMDLYDPQERVVRFTLSPPIVGFFELTMMKLGGAGVSKPDLAKAIAMYAGNSHEFVREVHGSGKTALGRALAYEEHLRDQLPMVCDWEETTKIIDHASAIAVSACYCRHKAEHLGTACAAPVEVCLSLNRYGEYVARRQFGRAIDRREAGEILKECRRHHLVHLVDNVRSEPAWICNCCSCCCGSLKAAVTHGYPSVSPSPFVPEAARASCRGCKRCVKQCPIGALSLEGAAPEFSLAVDKERCIGCGVCAHVCAHGAVRMKRRPTERLVPKTPLELTILRAVERGKLAEVLWDGSGPQTRRLDVIVQTIQGLADADREAAVRQLGSQFLQYMVTAG